MEAEIEKLSGLLREAGKIVIFSGAGISTESGIPDFRSPGGVWEKFDPSEFHIDRFLASEESRRRYWQRTSQFYQGISEAQPNDGHHAVVKLEEMGLLAAVVTQNVDGLHQLAGTDPELIIELHGTARHVHCLSCGESHAREDFQPRVSPEGEAPACENCGGLMKPATVSFGQPLPQEELARAARLAEECDLFLVIGSSLVVYPAAGLPMIAVRNGTPLVIINLQETTYDEHAALTLSAPVGKVLPPAVSRLVG